MGGRAPGAPPLDPPMETEQHEYCSAKISLIDLYILKRIDYFGFLSSFLHENTGKNTAQICLC